VLDYLNVPDVAEAARMFGHDVLLQGVALREPLAAVDAHEVAATLVDRLHVFPEARVLDDLAALVAGDVTLPDDHPVVEQPDVASHVAEVGEHLVAVRALVFQDLQ